MINSLRFDRVHDHPALRTQVCVWPRDLVLVCVSCCISFSYCNLLVCNEVNYYDFCIKRWKLFLVLQMQDSYGSFLQWNSVVDSFLRRYCIINDRMLFCLLFFTIMMSILILIQRSGNKNCSYLIAEIVNNFCSFRTSIHSYKAIIYK